MLQWQQNAIRQGQRTFEQALDVQQNMTESMWRNNIGTGRNVQQQSTEFVRNWMDAFFGAMGTMMDQEETRRLRQTVDEQFQELDEAQQEAWQAFEGSLEESVRAYEDLTQSQKELVNRSVDSFMEAQASMGEEVAHAAEEMGQQAREASRQSRQGGGEAEGSE
jgi:hypothetical protein